MEKYIAGQEALLAEKRQRLAALLRDPDEVFPDADKIRAIIAEISKLSKTEAHQRDQEQQKSRDEHGTEA